jgi:hypothetical protein
VLRLVIDAGLPIWAATESEHASRTKTQFHTVGNDFRGTFVAVNEAVKGPWYHD